MDILISARAKVKRDPPSWPRSYSSHKLWSLAWHLPKLQCSLHSHTLHQPFPKVTVWIPPPQCIKHGTKLPVQPYLAGSWKVCFWERAWTSAFLSAGSQIGSIDPPTLYTPAVQDHSTSHQSFMSRSPKARDTARPQSKLRPPKVAGPGVKTRHTPCTKSVDTSKYYTNHNPSKHFKKDLGLQLSTNSWGHFQESPSIHPTCISTTPPFPSIRRCSSGLPGLWSSESRKGPRWWPCCRHITARESPKLATKSLPVDEVEKFQKGIGFFFIEIIVLHFVTCSEQA